MAILSIKFKSFLKGTKLGTFLRRQRWNKGILSESGIHKSISRYMGEISDVEREKIFSDIVSMAKKYRFSAEEYFCYHFQEKSEDERKTFISDLNRIDFCEKLNKATNLPYFDDKMQSAQTFGRYYGRDVCGVKSNSDIDDLKAFLKKHPRFMFKPLTGTCGQGISIMTISHNETEKIEQLIRENCSSGKDGFIVEELIIQVPEMAQFHPSSLNTIRVATVKFDDGVEVIEAFFRTGRGGNIVDNAGAGGVFGTIDIETGIIDAAGDEYGNLYEVHPDSGLPIKGFAIPRWEEAKAMAIELADIVKGNRYSGWDLALTENGWIMIEGNARGQFVWQMPRQKGWLSEANAILRRLGLNEMKKLSI